MTLIVVLSMNAASKRGNLLIFFKSTLRFVKVLTVYFRRIFRKISH